jgi:branched-chain amino acid transport system substrate-binding protein
MEAEEVMMRNLAIRLLAGVLAAVLIAAPALAQQKLKIGFITTLTGPPGILGKHMKDSVDLAVEHLDGKVGGIPTEIIYGDDQTKPDLGVQLVQEMLQKHNVDIVAGVIWSNVLMAVVPIVTGAGKILVGTNAGASPMAGAQCNPLFITTSWNNDQTPEAMGKFMQEEGINDVYTIAPNYQAGKDMVAGFKRYFKGRVVDEVYTKLGQLDYQVEISQLRAKNPKVVFIFLPGGMGINFVRQYTQAGLRDRIPLYSVFTVDETTLPALKDAALGQYETRYWSPDLDIPASRRYVASFKKKYGYTPALYGAQSYDGIMLIDSAIRARKGDVKNAKALMAEMLKANYQSLRGPYKYNTNHMPIQNFYLLKAVKGADGGVEMQIQKTVFKDHKDAYYQDCKMK